MIELKPGKGDLDKRTYHIINLYENDQFAYSKNDTPNLFLKMNEQYFPLSRLLMDRRNNILKNYNPRTIPLNLLEHILEMTKYIHIENKITVDNTFEHWFK